MKFGLLILAVRLWAGDCISSPCVSTVNIPFDSAGVTDTRPGTWGAAGARQVQIPFKNVPAGYSVQIQRVYGDAVAWVHGKVVPGAHSGLLWGLYTSQVTASPNVEYGSFGCFLYLQGSVGRGDFRGAFDQLIPAGGTLASDNLLISQEAIFDNDTGQSIHMEVTMALVYQFVKGSTP